jgi:pantothenate kinase
LIDYDLEVGKIFATIKQCLNNIGTKQSNLAATFGELIDEVLRAVESVTPNTVSI